MKTLKKSKWKIPNNAKEYFSPTYDDAFKAKHKILYVLVVIAIIIILMIPVIIFLSFVPESKNQALAALFGILGLIGSLSIGVGLENLFMILLKQYLGHWVTIISVLGGLLLDVFSLFMLSIV